MCITDPTQPAELELALSTEFNRIDSKLYVVFDYFAQGQYAIRSGRDSVAVIA